MPVPGGAVMVTSIARFVARTSTTTARRSPSSAARPTNGPPMRRGSARSCSSMSRHATTGRDFPLRFKALELLGPCRAADHSPGRVVEQNGPRGGLDLETRRQVHCITRDQCRSLRGIAGDDHPGRQPDPEVQADAVDAGEFFAESRKSIPQLQGGPRGAQGIVLVRARDPEDRHDGIADELLDRAAVALEDRARQGVVAAEDGPRDLRVELFTEGGRADQVREQDRDDPPGLPGRRDLAVHSLCSLPGGASRAAFRCAGLSPQPRAQRRPRADRGAPGRRRADRRFRRPR